MTENEQKLLKEILERSNQIYSLLKKMDPNPTVGPVNDLVHPEKTLR
jgi:hypothetical protein